MDALPKSKSNLIIETVVLVPIESTTEKEHKTVQNGEQEDMKRPKMLFAMNLNSYDFSLQASAHLKKCRRPLGERETTTTENEMGVSSVVQADGCGR